VPPGMYTVTLRGAGPDQTGRVTVRKDPNTSGSEADIQAQTKALLEVRDRVNAVSDLINQMESVRSQLAALKSVLADTPNGRDAIVAIDAVDARVIGVESRLFNMTSTGRGQDFLRLPSQLIEKLSHLSDVLSLSDFAPTDQSLEVLAKLRKDEDSSADAWRQVVGNELAALNGRLDQAKIQHIVVPR
jgi:hypothetical protein